MLRVFHVLKFAAIIVFVEVVAERPRISERALELDEDVFAGEEECPQRLVLRSVLAKLGIKKLTSRLRGRITWKKCDVKRIRFKGHKAINGTLTAEIGKLDALTELDLGRTRVSCDLSVLQTLTQMQRLSLDSTNIAGDLATLQGLTQLRVLDLGNTKVVGDLSSLQHCTQMQLLSLDNTNVAGDLALRSLTQLQVLGLGNTKVGGDLLGLQNLTRMQQLSLDKTNVAGDLVTLQGLTQLQRLNLYKTEVAGDLQTVQGFDQLQQLDLRNTKVSGDLASLRRLTQLQQLALINTRVSGDLTSLQKLTKLQQLALINTKVSGDLRSLQGLDRIQTLGLINTKVAGDLANLQGLTKLKGLYLDNTHATGDLTSLQSLAKILVISLSNTEVTGDLASLQGRTQLKLLFLDNTYVAGDLESLRGLTKMQKISLRNTKVMGDLSSLQGLTQLQRLNFHNTKVAGDLSGLRGLTQLEGLSLDNTNVAGDLASLQNLTKVDKLLLANTSVAGDLAALLPWNDVNDINLEQTQVTGRLSSEWRGRWSKLRSLKLSGSHVQFLPRQDELQGLQSFFTSSHPDFAENVILPQLNLLELNGCPLDGDVSDLLLPLCGSPALATIEAAGCGLIGTLPSLKLETPLVDGVTWSGWTSFLAQSLKVLNLGSNKITTVEGIPEQVKVVILAQNSAVNFARGALKEGLTTGTFLDLQNVALSNTTEAAQLLKEGFIVKSDHVSSMSTEGGYECHFIVSTLLQVSPEKFLPEELCRCIPGFEGTGAQCHKCGANTFSEGKGSKCTPCPQGSVAGEGEATCWCASGGKLLPDESSCHCPAGHGLMGTLETECIPCRSVHLKCPVSGMFLTTAPTEIGFARLRENDTAAWECLPPRDTRCNTTDSNGSNLFGCASGYGGVLCSDCEARHYMTTKACKPCPTSGFTQQIWSVAAVAGGIGTLAVIVLTYMCLRHMWQADSEAETSSITSPFSAVGAFKEQAKQLAPILLHTCQLWAVLAALMKSKGGNGSSDSWEIPFIEASQLSVDSLKGALNLQCVFNDGAFVRLASAVVAPVAPVAVLLCCLATEICAHGVGVASALKALTLFYVGGASAASKLLSCQMVDGDETPLPEGFPFRKAVPHLRCDDPFVAFLDAVGYNSLFVYGVVVPLCLAYLYARQHLALLSGKTTVALATQDGDQWVIRLSELETAKSFSSDSVPKKGELVHIKRLLAASAAHIAVKMHGPVRVALKDGVVVAKPSSGLSSERAPEVRGSLEVTARLSELSSLVEAHLGKSRSRALTKAMMDRCLLEEAESSERALAGCKHILFKYSRCQNFYMEIILKLVGVALVSVVNNNDCLRLCMAITLLMAAVSGMLQPFLHPQANILQCCSFVCLAVAAVGFRCDFIWLSRGALAVPFLLSAVLTLRPDSTESLAVRIWRQMEKEISKLQDGKPLEILVETVSFV